MTEKPRCAAPEAAAMVGAVFLAVLLSLPPKDLCRLLRPLPAGTDRGPSLFFHPFHLSLCQGFRFQALSVVTTPS